LIFIEIPKEKSYFSNYFKVTSKGTLSVLKRLVLYIAFLHLVGSRFWTLDKTFQAGAPRSTTDLAPSLEHVDAAYFKSPHVFLFSADKYFKFVVAGNEINLAPGYPKLIWQGYPGLPNSPVDEVIRRGSQLWFFHGTDVTLYNPEKFPPIDPTSGSMHTSELEGFPEKVAAAIINDDDPKGSFVFSSGMAYKLTQFDEKLRSAQAPQTFREWLRCASFKN
jgi:hypothetical protein